MPIVARHHRWKDADHTPSEDWPEDCHVQWGSCGLVIGRKTGESYGTAFFEAFPKGGGFIRGEGQTIADAEASALARFRKESACQHQWGRRGYTNGAGLCVRCGAFRSDMFHPIVKLGDWKAPLCDLELDGIAAGFALPREGDDGKMTRYRRRKWLKSRVAGIDLPDPSGLPMSEESRDGHAATCEAAVKAWLRSGRMRRHKERNDGGMEAFFRSISRRRIDALAGSDGAASAQESPAP